MPMTSSLYGDGQKDADVFIDVTPTLLCPMRREAKAHLALVSSCLSFLRLRVCCCKPGGPFHFHDVTTLYKKPQVSEKSAILCWVGLCSAVPCRAVPCRAVPCRAVPY